MLRIFQKTRCGDVVARNDSTFGRKERGAELVVTYACMLLAHIAALYGEELAVAVY